jgi:hypothetical protein
MITVFSLIFNAAVTFGKSEVTTGKIAKKVTELKQQNVFKEKSKIFSVVRNSSNEELSRTVSKYTLLKANESFPEVASKQPEYLKLTLPVENGARNLTVLLYKVNISPSGYTLLTSDGKTNNVNTVVNYRGSIDNDDNSVVAMTFSKDETMGMISNNEGNYVLGKVENNNEGLYMIYNDKDMLQAFNFDCATNTSVPQKPVSKDMPPGTLSTNCVNWYWEVDNDIYVGKQSNINTVNTYVQGIFNQVSTLYANDGMSITLQTVFVWTTTDPYTGPSTSDYLNQFGSYRTSFAGDLATLLGYAGGGGVAWVDGICNSISHRMAYCGISSSFNNVPTYSWTVEVVAHEERHLFGSHHTHDCVWNGNNTKIDACGDVSGYPSGSCPLTNPTPPPGGGTIMSYCHLTSVGINFNLGFGPQPTALMLNNENTSSCLSACGGCTPPAQPGTISGTSSVCQSSSQTYSVSTISGATSYTWTLPSGWTGSSTSNSITATAGSTGGSVTVKANNSCGSSAVRTLTVTVNTTPASAGTITKTGGRDKVCPGDSRTYFVTSVSGITYTWAVPTGATVSSGQGTSSIVVVYNSNFLQVGTITVSPSNGCGSGPASSIDVKRKIPAMPGSISGPVSVCNGSVTTYSIVSVVSANSYIWTVPAGAAIQGAQTGTSISVLWGANGGNITVKAVNTCAVSAQRTLTVNVTCRQEGLSTTNVMKAEVFPNPTDGKITVKFSSDNDALYTISVSDVTGRILNSEKYKSAIGDNLSLLDLTGFIKGIYFLRIEGADKNELLKICVQ